MTAELEVERLAQGMGIKATLSPELREKPVLVIDSGEKPTRLLGELAFALHASVTTDRAGTHIARTASDRAAMQRSDGALMEARVTSRLARWDRQLHDAAALGSPAAQFVHTVRAEESSWAEPALPGQIRNQVLPNPGLFSPCGRLLRRFLSLIGPETLASIHTGETKVFSPDPNPQEGLVSRADEALDGFRREQEEFAADPSVPVAISSLSDPLRARLKMPISAPGPARFLLEVHRVRDTLAFYLKVFDAKGRLLDQASESTQPDNFHLPAVRARIVADRNPTEAVPISEVGAAFCEALSASGDSRSGADPSQDDSGPHLPDRVLLHPEEFDPDNVLVAGALGALCRGRSGPVVAAIPDDLFAAATYSAFSGRLNLAAFRELFGDTCEMLSRDGVTIFRPKSALASEPYTASRASLGRAMRQISTDGAVRLRPWCVLAYETGLALDGIPRTYRDLLRSKRRLPSSEVGGLSPDFAALLGSVSDGAWPGLGTATSVAADSADQRACVWSLLHQEREPYDGRTDLPALALVPEEMYPLGLPIGLSLRFDPRTRLLLEPVSHNRGKPGFYPLESIVDSVAPTVRQVGLDSQWGPTNVDRLMDSAVGTLAPGAQTITRVTLKVANSLARHHDFVGAGEPTGPETTFSQLPSAYKAAAYLAWSQMMERAKAQHPISVSASGRVPPPNP